MTLHTDSLLFRVEGSITVSNVTTTSEVLPSPLTKDQVNKVERHALSLYGEAQRTVVQFSAELRRLQDGGAHLLRGYPNFGEYVEHTFEGISANNAQQISRQGQVLLILEKHGRIKLSGKGENLPGTTGVRVLATILKQFGEATMLAVYDRAVESGRKVVQETVNAATAELIKPEPRELDVPASLPEDLDSEPDEDDEVTRTAIEERISHIQDLLWDVSSSGEDGQVAFREAQEEMQRLDKELKGEPLPDDEKWIASKR